ncbi:MAG: Asp-tRNA(Asn)/Glu-tRNA(Gln) amidotransferase subunit GatC [Candidatus Moranbacteria bacterium]|jgi:aspartyl-tRNA(Asn)/glutamyl-tRNA(Gln) amidotransferase subunit C|nr:Asp-tRNA(Asn)/Glu-tRNA(Gln) amidotransferase subunit GatC [Candidatus Moranbacteria bacterium]
MLSTEEVKHIALLARIGLSDAEVGRHRTDLSQVLDFFKELESLDTGDATDAGIPEKENDYREDRAEDFGAHGRKAIMENIPETKDGYVKVKSVF